MRVRCGARFIIRIYDMDYVVTPIDVEPVEAIMEWVAGAACLLEQRVGRLACGDGVPGARVAVLPNVYRERVLGSGYRRWSR